VIVANTTGACVKNECGRPYIQTPFQPLGKIEDDYDKLNPIIYYRFLILSYLV
jgi:hypothetical protein